MGHSIVQDKSIAFAGRIIKLHEFLVKEKKEFHISKQIYKSGTSIGANITEALKGQSKKDFIAKMYIAYKEAGETEFWIKSLLNAGHINDTQSKSILADCEEIIKILTKVIKTSKENLVKS